MNDQRSLMDQLETLYGLANKNGLYDAADWLRLKLDRMRANLLAKANLQRLDGDPGTHELDLAARLDVVDDRPVDDKAT